MTSLIFQPKDYFDLVKSIGEAKSKQEEDRIIAEEVMHLKKAINQTSISKKKMRELIIRSIYVEMLGQDASYCYIRAVELCASTAISQKKVGYLAASLCLSPDHEFRFMLVNQIQRDMKSSNVLEITSALTAVCKIVTEDMIPAVIGDVLNLLNHDMDAVRKKAVSAMHRFYQMDKRSVLDHVDKIRRSLCDKDPAVMGATLPLFQAMIQDDVMAFKDLVPSFVVILKQITEHRLPRDFDYHRIPAPWVQMALLKILALLGRGDQASSEGMYEVLADVIKRADTGINVGYAIVYECITTITTIYPNNVLLDAAASAISRFIRSESHNLKYIGIKGLASIVKDHPQYAADHQLAVIDCLEDPDETLKRKTLDLLFRMTNAVNVEFIVDKLLSFLSSSSDDHFRSDLVQQITQCAERFAPSNTWYVQTIIKVFQLAGDKIKLSVAQTLTQLIAEGAEAEEEGADDELRSEAVEHFLDLLDKPALPAVLAQTMAWVLGEYGHLSESHSKEEIMSKLCTLLQSAKDSETKAAVVTALSKLVAQAGTCPSKVLQMVQFYAQSRSLDVQQRCLEVLALLQHSEVMADVLPVDASCEDIDVDESLSFLDAFVAQARMRGAREYGPPEGWNEDDDSSHKKQSLKITPYAAPRVPAPAASAVLSGAPVSVSVGAGVGPTPLGPALTNAQPAALSIATAQGNQLLTSTRGAQVWGKKMPEPAPAPAPVSAPAAAENVYASDSASMAPVSAPSSSSVHLIPSGNNIWGASGAAAVPPTGAANPVAQSVPQTPPVPRELTEKEKMAAALFGGVATKPGAASSLSNKRKSVAGSAASTPSVASVPSSSGAASVASPAPTVSSISTAPPAAPVVLLDMLSDDIMPPAPAPVSTPVPAAMNILDLGFAAPAPAIHTPVLPHTPPPVPAPAPVPPSPSSSSSASLISDVFGNLDLSGGAPAAPLSMDNGMRPLVINTQEYGRRWGMTPVDARQSVSLAHFARFDLESLRHAMPGYFHHVESIPNTLESIYAATATQIGMVVLVHVKLHPTRRAADVLVKSMSQDLVSREAQSIASSLSAFRG